MANRALLSGVTVWDKAYLSTRHSGSCPPAVTEEGCPPQRRGAWLKKDSSLCFPVCRKGNDSPLPGPQEDYRQPPGAWPTDGLLGLLLMNERPAQLLSRLNEPP